MRARAIASGAAICGVLLAITPASALGDSAVSSNWAGYVAHRQGVRFGRVSASWIQGTAICSPGAESFSSVWIGIGGFYPSSRGLEQMGTELDCTPGRRVISSAWFELLPQPAHSIPMKVRPGDLIQSRIVVALPRVTTELTDRTTRQTFRRTFTPRRVDLSSADWIVETPTGCSGLGDCATLPLANFGTVSISNARTATLRGRAGAISGPVWDYTRVVLQTDVEPGDPRGTGAGAMPSPLIAGGTAFRVTYLPAGTVLQPSHRRTFPAGRRAIP